MKKYQNRIFGIFRITIISVLSGLLFDCSDMIAELTQKDTLPFNSGTGTNASNLVVSDHFGSSVSIDGNCAIIGSPDSFGGSVNPTTITGSAYIFEKDTSGNWTEQAILYASDGQYDDYFGGSVSIDGSYAIIGAPLEDGGIGDPKTSSGAAYIFEKDASENWIQRPVIHASISTSNDRFGGSVAISGNYAIIGATGYTNGGAVYIFERDTSGNWVQETLLQASDHSGGDRFGTSVSINGDYAIVGAIFESGGSGDPFPSAGAAYIFERDVSGTWTEKAILHASDMFTGDAFGYSVSISGNYAIIGADSEDGGAGDPVSYAGAAYVFERDSSGYWNEKAILHSSDMQEADLFGYSVSISGDNAIVSAPGEDGGSEDPVISAGAAYIFMRKSDGTWDQQNILHAPDLQPDDAFGSCVGISGNYAIMGAPSEDGGAGDPATDTGAVYFFKK